MIKVEWTSNDALSTEQITQTDASNILNATDCISRKGAIDALWKALFEYEDKTEKQFQESEDLDVGDWIGHRNFVQNMNDIDRLTILNLPSVQPELKHGKWDKKFKYHNLVEAGKCSVCGKWYSTYNFCPNCGAQMDGGKAEYGSDEVHCGAGNGGRRAVIPTRLIKELEGKTAEEQYAFIKWLVIDYGMQFTDSKEAVIEWLRGEKNECVC